MREPILTINVAVIILNLKVYKWKRV